MSEEGGWHAISRGPQAQSSVAFVGLGQTEQRGEPDRLAKRRSRIEAQARLSFRARARRRARARERRCLAIRAVEQNHYGADSLFAAQAEHIEHEHEDEHEE